MSKMINSLISTGLVVGVLAGFVGCNSAKKISQEKQKKEIKNKVIQEDEVDKKEKDFEDLYNENH